jgi:hypothetical protein
MLPSGPAHATALVARWVATARATAGPDAAASRQKSITEPTAKLRRELALENRLLLLLYILYLWFYLKKNGGLLGGFVLGTTFPLVNSKIIYISSYM